MITRKTPHLETLTGRHMDSALRVTVRSCRDAITGGRLLDDRGRTYFFSDPRRSRGK